MNDGLPAPSLPYTQTGCGTRKISAFLLKYKILDLIRRERQVLGKKQIRAIIDSLSEQEFTDADFDYMDDDDEELAKAC